MTEYFESLEKTDDVSIKEEAKTEDLDKHTHWKKRAQEKAPEAETHLVGFVLSYILFFFIP